MSIRRVRRRVRWVLIMAFISSVSLAGAPLQAKEPPAAAPVVKKLPKRVPRFVGDPATQLLHRAGCTQVGYIRSNKRMKFETLQEAIQNGFKTCKCLEGAS